jgi:hypothetical protein
MHPEHADPYRQHHCLLSPQRRQASARSTPAVGPDRLPGRLCGAIYWARGSRLAGVSLRKMMRNARSSDLITFARHTHETLPIKYPHLPSPALDQICMLELTGSDADGWPVDRQHFRQQILRDGKCIVVAAVPHHEEPTREPFLGAVCTAARRGYHHLLEKGVKINVHQTSKRGQLRHPPVRTKRGTSLCQHPEFARTIALTTFFHQILLARPRILPDRSSPSRSRCHLDKPRPPKRHRYPERKYYRANYRHPPIPPHGSSECAQAPAKVA